MFRSLGSSAWAAVLACACAGAPASKTTAAPAGGASEAASVGVSPFGPCILRGAELCYNALDDNCNGLLEEGCGVDGGIVQFMIAWQPSEADVDLEVSDPGGSWVELGRTTASGLVRDRDCPGTSGECKTGSLENVYLAEEEKLTRGKYQVVVRLERWSDPGTPVRVNFSGRVGSRSFGTELIFEREKQEHKSSWEL